MDTHHHVHPQKAASVAMTLMSEPDSALEVFIVHTHRSVYTPSKVVNAGNSADRKQKDDTDLKSSTEARQVKYDPASFTSCLYMRG